jgi:hypothetical protein
MSQTIGNLYAGALPATIATQFTGAALTKTVIRSASFCNSTAAPVALTVKLNPRTAGTDRTLISARSLAAGETYLAPELINQVIEAGGLLRCFGLDIEASLAGTTALNS